MNRIYVLSVTIVCVVLTVCAVWIVSFCKCMERSGLPCIVLCCDACYCIVRRAKCIPVYTCVYLCIPVYTCVYLCIPVYVMYARNATQTKFMSVYACVHVCTSIYVCISVCLPGGLDVCDTVYVCVCACVRTYACVCDALLPPVCFSFLVWCNRKTIRKSTRACPKTARSTPSDDECAAPHLCRRLKEVVIVQAWR